MHAGHIMHIRDSCNVKTLLGEKTSAILFMSITRVQAVCKHVLKFGMKYAEKMC